MLPGVPALLRAAQCRVLAGRLARSSSFNNFTLQNIHFVFFELSATKLALKNTFILGIARGDHRHHHGAGDRLSHRAPGGHRAPRARISRHRAGRHPRHRARRRAVSQLHAAAVRALRHAVDSADRLRHHRAAGRLSANAVGVPLRASGAGGRQPHPRRHAAASRSGRSPRRCCAPA